MSRNPSSPDQEPIEDLEDLYEHAPCGYLSIGSDGRIVKANKTLGAWTGFGSEQLVGKRLENLLTIATRIFYETNAAPLLSMHGCFDEISLELRTADQGRLPVFASGVERCSPNGQLLFTRLTILKASERRRYEQQLIEAKRQADTARDRSLALEQVTQELLRMERETAQLREQFIAVLGHDLRNPLAAIMGGADMLIKERLSERGARIVGMLQTSALRMAGLIENVLDFARGRLGGGIPLARTKHVSLEPVLLHVLAELQASVPDREFQTDISLSHTVDCDPLRLSQMMSNLLGNAITHGSPQAPIRLYAATEADALVISVANAGPAIPAEAMDRLFQPFFRGEVRASQQGLGLGLHISSEIATAHGGALTVTSNAEETRFTFRMPLRLDD